MADLHFELVTPERLVRSEDVYMVTVPGTEGDFGVLAGHAPVMSAHPAPRAPAIYPSGRRRRPSESDSRRFRRS